ncbi:hypothetical protein ACSVDA_02405 [Cytobacillus sp. Hm23]
MTQYKKVSTCCGSTVVKEEKECVCPCFQTLPENITANFSVSSNNTSSELYNGKAIGIIGTLLLQGPSAGDEVRVDFFSNGTLNKSISITFNDFNKFFTCDNVTRIEVVYVSGPGTVDGLMRWGGVSEPCK